MIIEIGDCTANLYCGDAVAMLEPMQDECVNCCITSPPYYNLRDYYHSKQIGNEKTSEQYVENIVSVFDSVKRVLRKDGTLWLNLGDTYINKNLQGLPWRIALALQKNGWILRSDIIWEKPNAVPMPVKDRPTTSHEYIFLFTKNEHYYYDYEAIMEEAKWEKWGSRTGKKKAIGSYSNLANGIDMPKKDKRNKRTVWRVNNSNYEGEHYATYPPELILPCVLAGTKRGDWILDPFSGAATTGLVALENERNYIGIELNEDNINISEKRLKSIMISKNLF